MPNGKEHPITKTWAARSTEWIAKLIGGHAPRGGFLSALSSPGAATLGGARGIGVQVPRALQTRPPADVHTSLGFQLITREDDSGLRESLSNAGIRSPFFRSPERKISTPVPRIASITG